MKLLLLLIGVVICTEAFKGPGSKGMGRRPQPKTGARCGGTAHGGIETRKRFQSPEGESCNFEMQRRTCDNGSFGPWSGSYRYTYCHKYTRQTMKMGCKQDCLPGWRHFSTDYNLCCASFWSCFGHQKWCEWIHWGDTEYVLEDMAPPPSAFPVELCADSTILRQSQKDILAQKGFTKCCMSDFLGLVVAGTRNYPDSYLQWASNIAAGILDQDNDGVIDDQAANAINVKLTGSPPLMTGGYDEGEEKKGDEIADDDKSNFAYAFSLQTWKARSAHEAKRVITEEVFHMVTTYVYAKAYPDKFGVDSWSSSVLTRECSAQMCVNWLHPENQCPTNGVHAKPPLQAAPDYKGNACNYPDCDCNEWFHQIALLLVGQEPGWRSPLLPSENFHSVESIRAILSKDFLNMMDDPKYHQLKAPISWSDSTRCIDVNHIHDNPGFYTCACVSPDDGCLSSSTGCVFEPNCPEKDGQRVSNIGSKNFATAESVTGNPAEFSILINSILHVFALIGLIFIMYSSCKNCKHSDYVDVSEGVEQEEI